MPGYGDLTAGAALGLFHCSKNVISIGGRDVPLQVDINVNHGSLLAQNFNGLWCWPLNLEAAGHKVDYFAMLHSDVEPEEGWVDKLIGEMEYRDLDVLGTVIPLKCPQGLTSIALQRNDGDTWRPACRLTMKEIYELPETFTAEETGHELLLNTGCWVCRFDSSWASKLHFTINDRIVLASDGKYYAEVEPEDWFFSRCCNSLGLRIGATRIVKAQHVGRAQFTNAEAWGQSSFDAEYAATSVLPRSGKQQFINPAYSMAAVPLEV